MSAVAPTSKQKAYLDFIRKYLELHGRPPAEADMQAFFMMTPPTVHQMVVTLTERGLITREPGKPRSIRLVEGSDAGDLASIAAAYVPPRPADDITEPLNPPIAPLVEVLRADRHLVTNGSCSGHGKKPAYIDLAVEGISGLHAFVERLNVVDRDVRKEAFFDVSLNWSEEVVTACAFQVFPDWIMLSWRVEGSGRGGSPSAALLAKLARGYGAATRRRSTPSRQS